MRILVDADACPVKAIIREETARAGGVPVLLFATLDHEQSGHGQWVRVAKGRDAVDHALFGAAGPGDAVVTADHGLAALCLGRGAAVLHPDGWRYREETMSVLLAERYLAARARRTGVRARARGQGAGRPKGPRPRTAADDEAFRVALRALLEGGSG